MTWRDGLQNCLYTHCGRCQWSFKGALERCPFCRQRVYGIGETLPNGRVVGEEGPIPVPED